MDQKDILKIAQKTKKDERELHIHKQSIAIGWSAVTIVMFLLLVLRMYANESSNDILLILMTFSGASTFYEYRKNKNIFYLFLTFLALLAMGLSAYNLLFQYGFVG